MVCYSRQAEGNRAEKASVFPVRPEQRADQGDMARICFHTTKESRDAPDQQYAEDCMCAARFSPDLHAAWRRTSALIRRLLTSLPYVLFSRT